MPDLDRLKSIDLAGFLSRHYGIVVNGRGAALCPFHEDGEPSLSVTNKNGIWLFLCHACGAKGSILDFVMKKEGLDLQSAAHRIAELEGIREPARNVERKIAASYDYVDESGKLVFQKLRYIPKSFALRRLESGSWVYNVKGVRAVPYRLNKIKNEPQVFITEGEKDADLLAGLGYPSTSAPFGAGSWPAELTPYFAGKAVYIVYDVGNEGKVSYIAAELWKVTHEITILTIPIDRREADVSDFLESFAAAEEKKAKFEDLIFHGFRYEPQLQKPKEPPPPHDSLSEISADAVKIKPISFLWQNVVPISMVTSLTGDPGEGKSLVAVDLTARLSRGEMCPAYGEPGPAVSGHTFYITSEGVPDMILVPRLVAAGADLSKVTIIDGIRLRNGDFSVLDVTRHVPILAARARDFPDLRLIVVDPIASFIPDRINTSQQNQVRQMMDRISDMAHKLGVAAVVIMHFNKTSGGKASQRTSGSMQFGAAVKMSWSVVKDPGGSRNGRLLVPQKSNITGAHESLSFHINEMIFPSPDDPSTIIKTAKIEYGITIDADPDELIAPPPEIDNNVGRAVRFLRKKFTPGTTLFAKELINEAEEAGIPKWALYKAKARLGIEDDKEDRFQGRTFWFTRATEGSLHDSL